MIFKPPTNYPEMRNNIVIWTVFTSLCITWISLEFNPDLNKLLDTIPIFKTKVDIELIEMPLKYFIIPFIFGMIEFIFKFHNRLSDILKIREKYDIEKIIKPLFDSTKTKKSKNKFVDKNYRDKNQRNSIMNDIFYKYVSYSNPQIDKNLVNEVLQKFMLFWVCLNSIFYSFLIVLIYLVEIIWFKGNVKILIFPTILIIISLLSLKHFYSECAEGTKNEITEILKDSKRKKDIWKALNALSS